MREPNAICVCLATKEGGGLMTFLVFSGVLLKLRDGSSEVEHGKAKLKKKKLVSITDLDIRVWLKTQLEKFPIPL